MERRACALGVGLGFFRRVAGSFQKGGPVRPGNVRNVSGSQINREDPRL